MISLQDFEKVEIRVGRVVSARVFEGAKKPAYILNIDFGDFGIKKSSAQLTAHYTPEELEGRLVAAVTNFEPKQIGPIKSEVLVVGFPDKNNEPVLVAPDTDVPLGGRLY